MALRIPQLYRHRFQAAILETLTLPEQNAVHAFLRFDGDMSESFPLLLERRNEPLGFVGSDSLASPSGCISCCRGSLWRVTEKEM